MLLRYPLRYMDGRNRGIFCEEETRISMMNEKTTNGGQKQCQL